MIREEDIGEGEIGEGELGLVGELGVVGEREVGVVVGVDLEGELGGEGVGKLGNGGEGVITGVAVERWVFSWEGEEPGPLLLLH